MSDGGALESLLKRDRLLVFCGLAGVTGLAWVYLIALAVAMPDMSGMAALQIKPWSALDFLLMFLMWAIMMIGMMLPGAAPMILLYGMVARKQRRRGTVIAPVASFVSGYGIAWTLFSLVATLLQWLLEQAALLSPMMTSTSSLFGGALLIAAGVYQWTPLKQACLAHCRSPIEFLARSWRGGVGGAIVMGLHHGLYCIGCCWVLMALLFVGGVMNLLWVAVIAVFVLIEKAAPFGALTGRISGALLVIAGVAAMIQG